LAARIAAVKSDRNPASLRRADAQMSAYRPSLPCMPSASSTVTSNWKTSCWQTRWT
jgi:hypothetical protein